MSSSSPDLTVFVFTDVVGSVDLKSRLGDAAAAAIMAQHDALVRELIGAIPRGQILQDTGDGILARFATASDAAGFALKLQHAIAGTQWGDQALSVRVGIHLGEVWQVESIVGGSQKLAGLALDLTSRVMSLAQGGQILMTRAAFDSARQNVRHYPVEAGAPAQSIRWMAHGPYLLKGWNEPVEIFEVGVEGMSPLTQPPSGEKGRRVAKEDDESTFGWRPAIGLEIPGRRYWTIERKLGEGGFGEVWLAVHKKLSQYRVFKFCFEPNRLRGLKREVRLFRFLKEELGRRPDIATILDYQFDTPPYLIEGDYHAAGNLAVWAESQGGISAVPLSTRLQLMIETADALSAAHSVGVLHKDVKPTNVLIRTDPDGQPHAVLTDFGIGILTDPARLAARNITVSNPIADDGESSGTGSYLYAPPEVWTGRPFSVQGDVYSLGVMLYQFVVGDMSRALAQGWEREISDEFLREDIALCTDGDPARRLSSAAELAVRLRSLEDRRRQAEEARKVQRMAASAKRRKALLRLSVAVTLVLAGVAGLAAYAARRDRKMSAALARSLKDSVEARTALAASLKDAVAARADAEAASGFLQNMLGSANPNNARVGVVSVRQILDEAEQDLKRGALGQQPQTEAAAQSALGKAYLALDLFPQAIDHLREALALRKRLAGNHPGQAVVQAMNDLGDALLAGHEVGAAEALAQQAVAAARTLSVEQKLLAQSLEVRARVLIEEGNLSGAEADAREALNIQQQLANAEPAETAAAVTDLAVVLRDKGQAAEAVKLFRQALEIQKNAHGGDHLAVARAMTALADALRLAGDPSEPEHLYRDALTMERQTLGEDHPEVSAGVKKLAQFLESIEQYSAAEEILMKRYDWFHSQPAASPVRLEELVQQIVELYLDWSKPQEADKWRKKVNEALDAEIVERTNWLRIDPQDPVQLALRGQCFGRRGAFAQAAADFQAAIRFDPTDHWCWYHLGCLLAYSGDQTAYLAHCQLMIDRFGQSDSAQLSERVAKTCLLTTDTRFVEQAQAMLNRALQSKPDEAVLPWLQLSKGMAQYRAAHFTDAIEWLKKSQASQDNPAALLTADLFIAMAWQRAGVESNASDALADAQSQAAEKLPRPQVDDLDEIGLENWLICQIALREASKTVPIKTPSTRP